MKPLHAALLGFAGALRGVIGIHLALPAWKPATAPAQPTPENPTPAAIPSAPLPPDKVTLNAGRQMPARLVDGFSRERSNAGDAFSAALD
jgi:hypothetical protein